MAFHDAFTILHTADLARAASFYVDRLGFEERYRFANFVLLGLDAFELGLTETTDVASAGRVALWLYSEDVDAEIDALRAADVRVTREPEDTEWANAWPRSSIPTGTRSSSASGPAADRPRRACAALTA